MYNTLLNLIFTSVLQEREIGRRGRGQAVERAVEREREREREGERERREGEKWRKQRAMASWPRYTGEQKRKK